MRACSCGSVMVVSLIGDVPALLSAAVLADNARGPRGSISAIQRRRSLTRRASRFSRAMAARNSGMPAPVRDEVGSTCGNAAGRFFERGLDRCDPFGQLGRLHLVGLGQHDLMAHRGLAQRVERRRRRRP